MGRSVLSLRVRQGTPSTVVSSCTPPESVRTRRAAACRAVTRQKDTSFAVLFRFGLIPLFLFSGTFFPITQLPVWIRPVAYVMPLWHGVALCRALSLGTADLGGALIHVGYLAAVVADYAESFDAVREVADFVVVNISSTNT